MRKTDISKFTDKINLNEKKPSVVKTVFSALWKVISTALMVCAFAGIIVFVSLLIYVIGIATEPTGIDLDARSLNLSSFIYIEDPETEEFVEYQTLYGTENRVWVDYNEMPEYMFDAIIAIEDKRFYEHNGVDWIRTGSAVVSLVTGSDSYGGSTLTQQLIKNITDDNEVSLNRKVREIFRAINLEKEYTKDEIIEAYLNVVNFGNNCQGVQSAATLYFDKDISQCSIAECAAIAGITQNPARWNPLVYPDNNHKRAKLVLSEMYNQEKITKEEYDAAKNEVENMTFVGFSKEEEDEEEEQTDVQNWYIDQMYSDLVADLAKYYDISEDAASTKLYTEGLKIYCAMDKEAQEMIEAAALTLDRTYDTELQCAMTMVDFDGRVIATVGSADKKDANLLLDRAYDSAFQPGSTIKPVVAYPYAIEKGLYNYSSPVDDAPLEEWEYYDGAWHPGPNNAYPGYHGKMVLPDAIEWSSNGAAAQTIKLIGPENAYEHVTSLMGFTHLDPDVDPYATGGLSLGGLSGGVTVREMASAYTYLANGGLHYDSYTYYYVTDQDGVVILDNRDNVPKQAYSPETAGIMNRLLNYNMNHSAHTDASLARVYGWDIIGKTGTTDSDKDSWYCGCSPYASLAVWVGNDYPERVYSTSQATLMFSKVMGNYLTDKEIIEYSIPDTLHTASYCANSGLLASSGCSNVFTGYYTEEQMPGYCYGSHFSNGMATQKPSETSSAASDSSESESTSESTSSDGDGTSSGDVSSDVASDTTSEAPVESTPEAPVESIAE